MIDLDELRSSCAFSVDDRPRIAFVHHGFRSTLRTQGQHQRARFASSYPPLGLLALMRQLEHDAEMGRLRQPPLMRFFDEAVFDEDSELARQVNDWLAQSRFRLVMVGVYTASLERVSHFLEQFDESAVCRVLGGPHITVAPLTAKAHLAVRGEGGAAIRHIVNSLLSPSFGRGADAAGLCFVDRGQLTLAKPAFDRSIAEIPPPAYDYSRSASVPQAHWVRKVGNRQQIYVCTQSCRARCTFCSTYLIHGRFVSRPVSFVAEDLRIMRERFGYDAVEFHDDDLLQHDDLGGLLDTLKASGMRWTCNARAEVVTIELAQRMRDSGCRSIYLGLEAMSQAKLDYFRKGCTVAQNYEAVKAFDAAGIAVISGFILGAPDDTLDGLLAEIRAFSEAAIYFLTPSILTPDIGTTEYQRARKRDPRIRMLESDTNRLSVTPRPDLFGSEMPYGLPTVCTALNKTQLNELSRLVQIAHFLKPAGAERLMRHTPSQVHDAARNWLGVVEQTARDLARSATVAEVRQLAHEHLESWSRVSAPI